MLHTILGFTPILVFFVLGYIFKTYLKFPDNIGEFLTKLLLKVTVPATVFLSVVNTKNLSDSWLIPVAAFSMQMVLFLIFLLITKQRHLPKNDECVIAAVPLIANTLIFMAPFFYLAYGDIGVTRVILYYIGNAFTIYVVAPVIYNAYGNNTLDLASGLKAIYTSFPVWAFVLGLIFNLLSWGIPAPLEETCRVLKESTSFLAMFFLGFRFVPHLVEKKLIFSTVAMKNIFGLGVGLLFSLLFTNNLDKITIIMGAMAPIGVMGLVYAEYYLKDSRLAPSLVSSSMIVGIVVFTLLISFFQYYMPL